MNGAIKTILLIAMLLSAAATAFGDTYVDYLNRGNTKYDKGDWDGAIADYNHAIELKSDYAAAYDNRGNAKRKKGDWEGAIADYTQAIDIKPNSGAPDGIGDELRQTQRLKWRGRETCWIDQPGRMQQSEGGLMKKQRSQKA